MIPVTQIMEEYKLKELFIYILKGKNELLWYLYDY